MPLLEKLYRRQYTPPDGPGAVVLSPTRELATQTFQVLRAVGSHHHFSAGLLVGGKKEFGLEQRHVPRMNVIIGEGVDVETRATRRCTLAKFRRPSRHPVRTATPGRLLQHMEQTAGLDMDRVCVLVLDEADRILDLGFREQMVRILDYLPPGNDGEDDDDDDAEAPGRQTMLFSATQTKRVSDLAALSLRRPEYLGVHDKEASKTPKGLEMSVMTVPLQHKLNVLYSFIKAHLRKKTIVFFSSCSQVRHTWQVFCSLQPGLPLMALHGKLKQETRTKLYFDFLQRPHAVLFATDVAARGLDFPKVDWVVQADAPEDVAMYIHRVGRTARYTSGGKALLFLSPQEEEGMMDALGEAKIAVKTCSINPNKAVVASKKAAAVVAASADMNLLAKKAFKSYLRSVHLMPNKKIFPDVLALPLEGYAESLGLASKPTVRFLKKLKSREEERKKKNVDYKLLQLKEEIKAERLEKRIAKLGKSADKEALKNAHTKKRKKKPDRDSDDSSDDGSDDDNQDLLAVKQVHEWGDKASSPQPLPDIRLDQVSKSRHAKKIRVDGSSTGANKKIVFDDEGHTQEGMIGEIGSAVPSVSTTDDNVVTMREEYLQKVRHRLSKTKDLDRQEAKERIQEKHKKRKMKEKAGEGAPHNDDHDGGDEDGNVVTLGGQSTDDEESGSEEDSSDGQDDSDSEEEDVNVKVQEELALSILGN